MPKLSERHLVIGGLFSFAFWLLVALPFLYSAPRYSHDETPNKCSAEESKNHGFWEKASCDPTAYFTIWLVAFTAVLAVSTIGLGAATIGLYLTGEKQAKLAAEGFAAQSRDMQASIKAAEGSVKIAKRAADIADRGVVLADRPWVALDIEIKGPLKFNPETIEIEVRGMFKNVGRSPAVNVQFHLDMFTGSVEAGGKAGDRARDYRDIPLLHNGYGVVLFPGADGFRQKTLTIKRADFIAAIADVAESATEDDRREDGFRPFTHMNPTIMAFCTYGLPGAGRFSRARFTTLVLDLAVKDDVCDGFDGSETADVPADRLELVQTYFSGETT